MALYLVERTDRIGYDEYDSFVVRAKSSKDALVHVLANYGSRYSGWRTDGSNVEVTKIEPTGEDEIILGSYNAG